MYLFLLGPDTFPCRDLGRGSCKLVWARAVQDLGFHVEGFWLASISMGPDVFLLSSYKGFGHGIRKLNFEPVQVKPWEFRKREPTLFVWAHLTGRAPGEHASSIQSSSRMVNANG